MAAIMVCTPDDEDEREVARDGKSNDWKVERKKRSLKLVSVAGGRPRPGPIQAPSSSFKLRQSEYAGEQRYQREKCKYCHVRPSIVRVDAQGRPSSSCSSYRESKRTTGARRASERRARDGAVIHKQMIDDGRR
jgi:hypothetical protein